MWNASLAQHFEWPHLFGYHLNVARDQVPAEAMIAAVEPTSPECVWAGDPGVPQTVQIHYEDGTYDSVPNPDWTPDSPTHETVFLLFVDEAEAKLLLPHLWIEEPVE